MCGLDNSVNQNSRILILIKERNSDINVFFKDGEPLFLITVCSERLSGVPRERIQFHIIGLKKIYQCQKIIFVFIQTGSEFKRIMKDYKILIFFMFI